MTNKKFTDDEITKGLECCIASDCRNCPLGSKCNSSPPSYSAFKCALDLINRQKAEIERLKKCPKCVYEYDGEVVEYCVQSPCSNFKTVEQVKAEACKNFSQKLIKSSRLIAYANGFDIKAVVDVEKIVKILKETVSEE